ncbi:MAG: zf-HC2 domain-containing protein [Gammaproteobacteria bacterium]|nr:zf-HC2 domain-containing protein [Gammaproteobacteria bacterium]
MSSKTSSQCQLFQLHIDAFLDNELEAARAEELHNHLQQCQACSEELAYAERLHKAVVSLPVLDCSDHALEPVDRLFAAAGGDRADVKAPGGFWSAVGGLIDAIPVPVRLGIPVAATILLAIGLGRELLAPGPAPAPELAGQPVLETPETEYSPTEIRQAFEDLELAMDYLGRISERTEVMIQDRFLLRQLENSMNASFTSESRDDTENDPGNGPI